MLLANSKNTAIRLRVKPCTSFLCRLRGLTFRRQIPEDWGLLFIYPRSSRVETAIHMFFVFTDLAVIWLDENYQVVDKVLARPWRPYYAPRRAARYILETHPDQLDNFHAGDSLNLIS